MCLSTQGNWKKKGGGAEGESNRTKLDRHRSKRSNELLRNMHVYILLSLLSLLPLPLSHKQLQNDFFKGTFIYTKELFHLVHIK